MVGPLWRASVAVVQPARARPLALALPARLVAATGRLCNELRAGQVAALTHQRVCHVSERHRAGTAAKGPSFGAQQQGQEVIGKHGRVSHGTHRPRCQHPPRRGGGVRRLKTGSHQRLASVPMSRHRDDEVGHLHRGRAAR